MLKVRNLGAILSVLFFIQSCGKNNLNKMLFVSKKQEQALDVLLNKGQIAYDHAEYDDALDYADKAYKISPDNESVAVLLGYVHLAIGGIDSFSLAKGLIDSGKTDKTSSLLASSKGASETLSKLKPVLGLQDKDIFKLGDLRDADDDYELFEEDPVILPYSMTDARKADLAIMKAVNKAIGYICPFVDNEAKIDEDERHDCGHTDNPRSNQTKSHFIWAFSHLAEALAFNAVVLYQEDGKDKTNIENRVDSLNEGKDEVSITSYVSHVVNLSDTFDAIFPVGDSDSQLQGVLNGLTTVAKTFALMPGMPKNITKGIDKAVASIEEKKKLVTGQSDENKDMAGLKAELTKKMGEDLGAQIDEVATGENPPSAEQLAELCAAYSQITAGTGTPPESCD